MKFLVILALGLNVAFAQDSEVPREEFKFFVEAVAAQSSKAALECSELKVEHDTRKVNYVLTTTPGSDYENEYYINFSEVGASNNWNSFIAYEDFNGSPMGSLEKKEVEAGTVDYIHTFNGYYTSQTTIRVINGLPTNLKFETIIPLGYKIMKLNCPIL